MKLHIYGVGDKRLIMYPIFRLLNLLDGGVLVTDNGAYRCLKPDESGYIGNIKVIYGRNPEQEELEYFANIISDCWEKPVVESDTSDWVTVWVRKVLYDVEPPDVSNYTELFLDFVRPIPAKGKPKPLSAVPTLEDYRMMSAYEVSGEWSPFKYSPIIAAVSTIMADVIGLEVKTIRDLLCGKIGGKSK